MNDDLINFNIELLNIPRVDGKQVGLLDNIAVLVSCEISFCRGEFRQLIDVFYERYPVPGAAALNCRPDNKRRIVCLGRQRLWIFAEAEPVDLYEVPDSLVPDIRKETAGEKGPFNIVFP